MRNGSVWAFGAALLRVLRWKVAVALLLMVSLALTEGLGLLLLVPLLQLVGLDVQQGSIGRLAELVASLFALAGLRLTLASVLAVYVLIVGVHALASRWQAIFISSLENEFAAHLRRRLYRSIAGANWLFFSRRRSSDFSHALTAEIDRIDSATYYLLGLIANSMLASIYLLMALQLSAVMTGLVLGCGTGLFLALRNVAGASRRSGERLSEASSELYAAVSEHLSGMKVTKGYAAEDRHVDIFSRLTNDVARVYVETARNYADARSWFELGSVVILSCILYVSFEILGTPTATVLLLLFLFFRIMPRLSSLQHGYQGFINLLPAFNTIMELQIACDAAAESKPGRDEDVELRREIRFEQVSFRYVSDGPEVVRDLDLAIRAGETVAIVGPSGAGKSTIADLVIGLIVPNGGRVLVDGQPLTAERMRSWRRQIGYVAQDTFLFHDTIRANLVWARPDASPEQIRRALRLAAAEQFISGFPDGLETVLGDRGVRLSGGERQRLALARAVLREPALLILDEATSSLDSENEQHIQHAIEELHGRMTILVIAHRLSTVRKADVVHVLDGGRLVESGAWDVLIAKPGGRLRALCRAQGMDVDAPSDPSNGSHRAAQGTRVSERS